MSRFSPTPAEAASLSFLVPGLSLPGRYAVAAVLFAVGLGLWFFLPWFGAIGLVVVLTGHLPLWVRRLSTAPGGATPQHEEVWAPVEEGWMGRLEVLEAEAASWDTSPWDLTSGRGCAVLAAVGSALVALPLAFLPWLGMATVLRLLAAGAVLFAPLWLNGMRTVWQPSELRLKGEALRKAREAAAPATDFEEVPLLALRRGERGRYPVDARLMLRPVEHDGSGLIGVQVQVALNNVQGKDYPYLYCVVLGREGFELPSAPSWARPGKGRPFVYERGRGEGADYLVIRQYASNSGGWHTDDSVIQELVTTAVAEARQARQRNAAKGAG